MSGNKDFVIENGVLEDYKGSDTDIVIPEGVTAIGYIAFQSCKFLKSVDIPDGVTIIGERAFYNCTRLSSINIPDGVTSIGDKAFYNCQSLKSITIPDSVKSIGKWAFDNCHSLTSINIPDGVTSIGYCAFNMCESLASVNIPDGVTSIDEYAFYNCTSLKSITIPDSVKSIGRWAFFRSGLKDIYYKGTEHQWNKQQWNKQQWNNYNFEDYCPTVYCLNVKVHFNCKDPDLSEEDYPDVKVNFSCDLLEIEKEVRRLLSEGKSEAEIYKTLKAKGNTSDNDIVNALSKVNFNSPMVLSFCDKVILPDITSLLGKGRGESKYTVGEVAEIMYKKHPKPLVDSAIVKVLYNEYLVD